MLDFTFLSTQWKTLSCFLKVCPFLPPQKIWSTFLRLSSLLKNVFLHSQKRFTSPHKVKRVFFPPILTRIFPSRKWFVKERAWLERDKKPRSSFYGAILLRAHGGFRGEKSLGGWGFWGKYIEIATEFFIQNNCIYWLICMFLESVNHQNKIRGTAPTRITKRPVSFKGGVCCVPWLLRNVNDQFIVTVQGIFATSFPCVTEHLMGHCAEDRGWWKLGGPPGRRKGQPHDYISTVRHGGGGQWELQLRTEKETVNFPHPNMWRGTEGDASLTCNARISACPPLWNPFFLIDYNNPITMKLNFLFGSGIPNSCKAVGTFGILR